MTREVSKVPLVQRRPRHRLSCATSEQSLCDVQIDERNLGWEGIIYYPPPNSQGLKSLIVTTKSIATGAGLHIAAYMNNVSAGELHLDHGDVDLRDANHATSMHISAFRGSLEIVRLLLKRGANPIAMDLHERTPAMLTSQYGNLKILYVLEKKHSFVFQRDIWVVGVFHYAGIKSTQSWSYLLRKGLSPYVKNELGNPPIDKTYDSAVNRSIFQTFILHLWFDFGRSAQMVAELDLNKSTAKSIRNLFKRPPRDLLARAVNTTSVFGAKLNPLSQAALRGRVELLEPLIQAGATLDHEGGDLGTPLLYACSSGRLSAMKYLVRAGAKIFATRTGRPFTAVKAAMDFHASFDGS
jgi:hypothetical protein